MKQDRIAGFGALLTVAIIVCAGSLILLAGGEPVNAVDDVTFGREIAALLAALEDSKYEVVVGELRTMGMLLDRLGEDGPYPEGRMVRLKELEHHFVPRFVDSIPTIDPWGQPYFYWSDSRHYMVVSGAKDGQLEGHYQTVDTANLWTSDGFCRQVRDEATDIILADGVICRWRN